MTPANRPRRSSADPVHPPRRMVLLADGSRAHRRMLSLQLERAGYRVIEAANGPQALAECISHQPDLILSDWMLDGLNGPDLCRSHRALDRASYGYFILLTSKKDSADIAAGLQSGADDFLVKPISGPELLARLKAGERVLDMQASLTDANRELQDTLERLNHAQEQMNSDLREARKLQQALIAERQRRLGDWQISLVMRPASLIGGDLVGLHQIDERRVAIHAVDVSGHGVASALLTARLAVQIEGLSHEAGFSPSEIVARLNALMLQGLRTDSYLTMIYGVLDTHTGQMRLVQAGHPHPLIQRATGEIERIGCGGLPVGLIADATYDEVAVQLDPGDRLLITSDGITEATSRQGEPLGEDGLRAILQLNAPLNGYGFLESMCWSVSEFAGGERSDDLSALLVERLTPARIIESAIPRVPP